MTEQTDKAVLISLTISGQSRWAPGAVMDVPNVEVLDKPSGSYSLTWEYLRYEKELFIQFELLNCSASKTEDFKIVENVKHHFGSDYRDGQNMWLLSQFGLQNLTPSFERPALAKSEKAVRQERQASIDFLCDQLSGWFDPEAFRGLAAQIQPMLSHDVALILSQDFGSFPRPD